MSTSCRVDDVSVTFSSGCLEALIQDFDFVVASSRYFASCWTTTTSCRPHSCFLPTDTQNHTRSTNIASTSTLQTLQLTYIYPSRRRVRLSVCLFFRTISQQPMQRGSPNMAHKCSIMSLENLFILGLKGQRSRLRGTRTLPALVLALL